MKKSEVRNTENWFINKEFKGENSYKSGPGAYNFHEYEKKQSWNKGSVPFGSSSMLEDGTMLTADAMKGVRNIPTHLAGNPGPGSYSIHN